MGQATGLSGSSGVEGARHRGDVGYRRRPRAFGHLQRAGLQEVPVELPRFFLGLGAYYTR